MKGYVFFSVHEALFHPVAQRLRAHGIALGGFVWGKQQARAIAGGGGAYDPLVVFTRDLLPRANDGAPADLAWLARRERELGVSIQRMLAAERHLLAGRTHAQIMRLAEVALREIAAAYDRARPDFVFSEDVACFHSYAHFVLARERGIPFYCIGSARLPYRLSVYTAGMQRWERVEARYRELRARGLPDDVRALAHRYVTEFRARPTRPTGMDTRAQPVRIERGDVTRFRDAVARYLGDRDDPTMITPLAMIEGRLRRMARVRLAARLWDRPRPGEPYVLYALHFQPEASTLVQAPMYVDQLALLRDLAASLPIGHRLYVKEHLSSRGRRPLAFYRALRAIPAVRLLSPDEDSFALVREARAVAVLTGTIGWEALMLGRPVVSFGDVFYNLLPHVHRAGLRPKDEWYAVLQGALTAHRPDDDALLALIAAMHECSYPGFIANPSTFPRVRDPDNIANVAAALLAELGAQRPGDQPGGPRELDRAVERDGGGDAGEPA